MKRLSGKHSQLCVASSSTVLLAIGTHTKIESDLNASHD